VRVLVLRRVRVLVLFSLSTIATSWLDSLKRASRTAAGYKGVKAIWH
jgi:hypothetical protein